MRTVVLGVERADLPVRRNNLASIPPTTRYDNGHDHAFRPDLVLGNPTVDSSDTILHPRSAFALFESAQIWLVFR